MLSEDRYFQDLSKDELWQRYCGFLDLPVAEFMNIQKKLLMDEVDLVADSTLGKKIMGGRRPKSVEKFRQMVPITTYEDYEPYLSERQEDVLGKKPYMWCHSSGRGGSFKWLPCNLEYFDKGIRDFLASWILAAAKKKGEVNIMPGLRVLALYPPPPYASGSSFQYITEHFSCRIIPPLETGKDMGFRERMQKGFEIAIKEGIDVITAISSVLVRIGEGFEEKTRDRGSSKRSLHPKVIFRVLKALMRSRLQGRPILPKDLWPAKAILCGGMDSHIYKSDVAHYWGSEPLDFYVATETFFLGMQAWNMKALTFLPDSVFLEFIPRDKRAQRQDNKNSQPQTVLLDELEEGKLYEVIITQFYGMPLLRYRLDDVIKVVSLKDEETGVNLPQIVIQGRVGSTIDLAGLAELDEKMIWQAIANTGIKYVDWIACKEYEGNQSFIHLYLELKEEREADEVASLIDEQLRIVDTDYRDIDSYLQQQPVRVTVLSPGTFQRYTDEKIKEGADQTMLKPAHMNTPPAVVQHLLQLSEVNREE